MAANKLGARPIKAKGMERSKKANIIKVASTTKATVEICDCTNCSSILLNIDFQIEYPMSWTSWEDEKPDIIQTFGSNNGKGPLYASIIAKNLIP